MVLAMTCVPLVAVVGTAGAAKPARTCPPPFLGPLTFQQVVDEFPPPPGLPPEVIAAILDSIDKNDDGNLCAKGIANGENFIDNTANVP
jgi:hypothetical protein